MKLKQRKTSAKELASFKAVIDKRCVKRQEERIASFEFREGLALAGQLLADEHKAQIARLAREPVESGKLDEAIANYRRGLIQDVTLD